MTTSGSTGTPWHGEAPLASPARARLDRVFFLRHARGDELREVGPTDAAARLFAACFPLFHDARAVASTLAFLESVGTRVPCDELGFVSVPRSVGLLSARASK